MELSWERRLGGIDPDILVMLRPGGIMEVLGTKLGGDTPREGGREADFLSTTNRILFQETKRKPLIYTPKIWSNKNPKNVKRLLIIIPRFSFVIQWLVVPKSVNGFKLLVAKMTHLFDIRFLMNISHVNFKTTLLLENFPANWACKSRHFQFFII